ncbi:hypothetical protein CC78DRAFT_546745 [Lojkania enalia]|uniref:Uncharacterized protein n=1 Tax=Lojkania enalia TaxID=147567 RepID=A0A9P4N411_9PLEO|nr:hypothetical protein CC78DRAFT_546745 [Didymosphaeria enalia]
MTTPEILLTAVYIFILDIFFSRICSGMRLWTPARGPQALLCLSAFSTPPVAFVTLTLISTFSGVFSFSTEESFGMDDQFNRITPSKRATLTDPISRRFSAHRAVVTAIIYHVGGRTLGSRFSGEKDYLPELDGHHTSLPRLKWLLHSIWRSDVNLEGKMQELHGMGVPMSPTGPEASVITLPGGK